jgi:hypothetical protein
LRAAASGHADSTSIPPRRERCRLKNQPELRGFLVSGELREEHLGREEQVTEGNRLGPTLEPPAIAPEQRGAALRWT